MSTTVIGGFAVQWIIGIISDRFDRTLILIIIACLVALLSFGIVANQGIPYHWFLAEMAIFGGLIFAVYPVAVARANDVFEGKERVTIIQPAEQVNFAPMKNTSSVAMVLDPRTDAEADKG